MNNDHISIGKAAEILGVSVVTVRRWERSGKLASCFRTFGNHRRFRLTDVLKITSDDKPRINICYARVSSHDQKPDLERQCDALMNYCAENEIESELISDLGSGLNFKKRGLNRLLTLIVSNRVDKIYVTHKDRLLRFGTELVVNIARKFGTSVVVLNDVKQSFEQQLASDVLEIITVFSAKLYGSRSNKKKKKKAVDGKK